MTPQKPQRYVSAEQVEKEVSGALKVQARERALGYPLHDLSDRQFETLLWDIFRAELISEPSGSYDEVWLMQGVAERGRDCALLLKGTHVGVIQCKKYTAAITRPDVGRELLKFLLHSIKDPQLMPEPKGFVYYIAIAYQLNDRAKEFVRTISSRAAWEADIANWTSELVAEYSSLQGLIFSDIEARLFEVLTLIEVRPLDHLEIGRRLERHNAIIDRYFAVRKVVDSSQVIEAMEKLGRGLHDSDVRRISDKLVGMSADRRFDIGGVSLWGYPREFIASLIRENRLQSLMLPLVKGRADIDGAFMDYLRGRIEEEVIKRITIRGAASPFTLQAVTPYLLGRLLPRLMEKNLGKVASAIIKMPEGDILSIRDRLLDVGRDVLKNDYSKFAGDAELLEYKRRLARWLHSGFESVDQMRETFDRDWKSISAVVAEIERDMERLLPDAPVAIIPSNGWFDDPERVGEILKKLSTFDGIRPQREGNAPTASNFSKMKE